MKARVMIDSQVRRFIIRLLGEEFPAEADRLQWNNAEMRKIACEDFMFYLRVLWCAFDDEKFYRLVDDVLGSKDFQMLAKTWLSEWSYQWRRKVKIRFNDFPRKKQKQLPVPSNLFVELQEASVTSLVNNGALCGLALVSKAIVERVFNLLSKRRRNMSEKAWRLLLLTTVCRESRIIAKSTGPLLFIKPNKHYFQFYRASQ